MDKAEEQEHLKKYLEEHPDTDSNKLNKSKDKYD